MDVSKKLAEGDKYLYQWLPETFHWLAVDL